MSRLVSRSSRVSVGVRPIIDESVGSEPGPTPPMTRPWVRWSSSISRSAAHNGLWYGSDMTPVPNRIRLARSAAAAMNTSGELMISLPAEWCSPIHTSSKPIRSRCSTNSRSRCSARVGLVPARWNGAMKYPKRSLAMVEPSQIAPAFY